MKPSQAIDVFAALAQDTRLAIFQALMAAGRVGLSAGEIADAVGASPSRASFHLAALANAGLVRSERASRKIVYRADFETAGALMTFFLRDCCRDDPELRRCVLSESEAP